MFVRHLSASKPSHKCRSVKMMGSRHTPYTKSFLQDDLGTAALGCFLKDFKIGLAPSCCRQGAQTVRHPCFEFVVSLNQVNLSIIFCTFLSLYLMIASVSGDLRRLKSWFGHWRIEAVVAKVKSVAGSGGPRLGLQWRRLRVWGRRWVRRELCSRTNRRNFTSIDYDVS